jgi:hypothetical protein
VSESKITRADLEAKFREVQTELTSTAERAKGKVMYAAAGGFVLLVLLTYVLGRRSGKKRSTVVEIRRL